MTTALQTRRPTGKPSWPITLLAGAEKSGKSWACAVASGSSLVGRTFWVGIGEDDPDEYGLIPGADFEIVQHDGTYRAILDVLAAINTQPAVDGKPTLLVVDSMTKLWDLLTADVQAIANRRAKAKAEKYRKPVPAEDAQITMDLWNLAKDRWGHIIDELRAHQGPVLVTARLEQVTVMDGNGQPTSDKELKVKAEKSLPYDVGAIVEMPARGETWLRGVRSARMQIAERTKVQKFTVDKFWHDLGLDGETGARHHSGIRAEDERHLSAVPDQPTQRPAEPPAADEPGERDWMAEVAAQTDAEALRALYRQVQETAESEQVKNQVKAAIVARSQELTAPAGESA